MTATLAAVAVTVKPWASHDTRLTLVTVIGIAIIVVLKMHPFLSLILGSAFVGLTAPVPLAMIVTNFEDGVGSTLK
jgi:GntP family gluconate:H+ symporter